MKDGPQEIASLMNLILPLTQQMPTNKNFLKEYFPSTEAPTRKHMNLEMKKNSLKAVEKK